MRILTLLLVLIFSVTCNAEEFRWARGKFKVLMPAQEEWDEDLKDDIRLVEQVEKLTSIKVEKKVNVVTFDNLEELVKYPLIYMTASRTPVFSDLEIANLREYMSRGGIIFADDHHEGPGGLGTDDEFYRGMKKILEEKIFPGKKMEVLPDGHELFHCHYDLEFGFPHMVGTPRPLLGLKDAKDSYFMAFVVANSIKGGWSQSEHGSYKRNLALKAAINLIVYSMTH